MIVVDIKATSWKRVSKAMDEEEEISNIELQLNMHAL